ncbi:MAG: GIY-YIG nuclease family protein [Nitrospirae bacterium]|nr:GIY-YIG nuclease family protein [Nitrospirota bacterium]
MIADKEANGQMTGSQNTIVYLSRAGYVYVVSNKKMPGLLKVGRTDRLPTERAKELATTGVSGKYDVEYFAFFQNMERAEHRAHKALRKYHDDKKFFKVDVNTAISVIEGMEGERFVRVYSKPEADKVIEEKGKKKKAEDTEDAEDSVDAKALSPAEEFYKNFGRGNK